MQNQFFSQSDKYECVATLGTGSFGTVYLVRHRILECLRAIKVIPKACDSIDSVLSEARLLRSLQHPGIPTIYEIEEDNDYYYLIEEYIDGENLEAFLLNQMHISHNTFYDFSTQICEIFCYLHSLRPDPILYMDLKPEHIIICHGKLKLIDFNVSLSLSKVRNPCNLYGNQAYCAPEITSGAIPNTKWDIYAIGKILLYIKDFLDSPLPNKTQQILKKASAQNPAYRYETVDELSCALVKEQNKYHQELPCKTIAVVGSNFGCGSTHIAISLVSTLNYLGYSACYYETDDRKHLHLLSDTLMGMKEHNGCLYYKYFCGYPKYGPGVFISKDTSLIRVYDYGNDYMEYMENVCEADLVFFLCSSGILKWQIVFENAKPLFQSLDNPKVICNMGQKADLRTFAQRFRLPVYTFPFISNPFQIRKDVCRLFTHILQLKRRNPLFFPLKRLFSPKKS